jgi:hypothetical protein
MSISCSGSERGSANSSPCVSLYEGIMNICGTTVKENDGGGWSSDDVVLWLGRRQNKDMVKWWGE